MDNEYLKEKIIEKLKLHQSPTPSKWREAAEKRRADKSLKEQAEQDKE